MNAAPAEPPPEASTLFVVRVWAGPLGSRFSARAAADEHPQAFERPDDLLHFLLQRAAPPCAAPEGPG